MYMSNTESFKVTNFKNDTLQSGTSGSAPPGSTQVISGH